MRVTEVVDRQYVGPRGCPPDSIPVVELPRPLEWSGFPDLSEADRASKRTKDNNSTFDDMHGITPPSKVAEVSMADPYSAPGMIEARK
ncbi:hypothetical protein V6N12_042522 [Hibiscus sabdariffa]|uniref:Uncharacterized protein n=1 Tax=Hibiscus sabdariffa TaxID=183260 RepID=A0ABR2EIQ1_9ROSI